MQRLLFITLAIFSYQTAQAACALKSELEQKGSTAALLRRGYEWQAKEQQTSQGKKGISLCADDEVFKPYFPKAIQGIIRAYALNPLDFVTVLYRQQIVKMENDANIRDDLAIQPDGTIILHAGHLGDIHAYDSTGRKLNSRQSHSLERAPRYNCVIQTNGTVVEQHAVDLITVWRYQQGAWKLISNLQLKERTCLSSSDGAGIFLTHNFLNDDYRLWNEDDCSLVAQYRGIGVLFLVVGDGIVIQGIHQHGPIYSYVVNNRDKSIRSQGLDTHDKIIALAVGSQGSFLTSSCQPHVGSVAYIRKSNFMLSRELKGHSAGVVCGTICPDETILTGSEDQTIRIWNNDGSMRSVLRHQMPVRRLAENNGMIVTGFNSNLCISHADTRLTELLGQFSFAQQQEIKELIQALEEMYWMKHNSIVITPEVDAKRQAEAIANIELVLFGKHAELFAALPRAIQENIMQNMRCKISIEQSNSKQTKQADNSKESKS